MKVVVVAVRVSLSRDFGKTSGFVVLSGHRTIGGRVAPPDSHPSSLAKETYVAFGRCVRY